MQEEGYAIPRNLVDMKLDKIIDNDSKFCEYCGSAIKNIDNNNDNNVSLKLRVLQYLFVIWLLLIIVLWIISYSLFDYEIGLLNISLLTLFYIIYALIIQIQQLEIL